MKVATKLSKWFRLYPYHNAALRELMQAALSENQYLRHRISREETKVEYLLVHRTLLTDELNELKGRNGRCS